MEAIHRNRKRRMRQHLNGVACLQVVLAHSRAVRELPWRREVVHERIVQPLRYLVTERQHVDNIGVTEESRIQPGCGSERLYEVRVPLYRCLERRVEADDAAC